MSNTSSAIPLTITRSMEEVKPDMMVQIFTLIQLSYGVPSYILIVYFFFLMSFGKKYSSSFYRLVQWDLLVNLLCYTNSWFAVRLGNHPEAIPVLKSLTYLLPKFLTWTRYFAYWFMHMQFMSAVALSVHRLTSVMFHSSYEKMWKRFFLVFCFLCIVYCCLCNMLIPGFIVEVNIINGTLMSTSYPLIIYIAVDLTAYFSAIYFVLLVVVGMATSRMVTKKIQAASFSNGSVGKKLTKIALTYGTIYSGILLWSVISALNSNFKLFPAIVTQISSNLLPFASDMMTLALPYILMIYDTNIQRDVLRRKSASWNGSRVVTSSFVVSR